MSNNKNIIGYCPKCGAPIFKLKNSMQAAHSCRCMSVTKTFSESFDLKK